MKRHWNRIRIAAIAGLVAAAMLAAAVDRSMAAGQPPSTQFLEERILASLGRARLKVTEEGVKGLRAAIADAAARYRSERRAEAETNADKLAARIEYHARETGADITAEVVDAAFDDVCPLWPFCE